MNVDVSKFDIRFRRLTGHQPYRWQVRLFESLVGGHIPQNLGAPTGAGKTNVIPCWLLALVENRDLPRRLVYVVDRRSVVDQSTKVVEEMYAKIAADASLAESLNLTEGLGISTLRGEYADNQEWSHLPHRPSVVCGTVDMVGSRLLFSGYGDGAYSRALHAGLLGNDTLIVFDECHLVPAFAALLENIHHAGGKLKPFHVMLMSATGSSGSDISLNDDDLNTEPLKSRLQAVKEVQLINHPQPIKKIVSLARDKPPTRTIVFVQSPSTAVEIAAQLTGKVVLLTGTMRGKERDDLVDNPVFQAFTKAQEPAEPHYIVATSAGEVGIDLTCSRLITDATYAPSLVQRFGRCNRFAECEAAQIYVITCDKDWAIYGDDLTFIKSLDGDASCINLWERREDVAQLAKIPPMIATLEPHVLDVLSMTSLHNDVPVDAYLRGKQKDSRYVDICFRQEADLLADMNEWDFYDYLKHFPVLSFEKLSEKAKRVRDLVEELQSSAKYAVLMPDGTKWKAGRTLSELPRNLTNCLLILPEHCGLGLQGGMLVKSDNGTLDISTIEHKHHPARTRLILPAGEEYDAKKNEKVAFDREVRDKRIVIVKKKQIQSHKTGLLSEHSAAVRQAACQFAEKAGLDAEIVNAIVHSAQCHDAGKANIVWQLAAKGGNIKNPIAKTSYVSAAKLTGFRHEFESMDSVDDELAKHLVASHHAGARPSWTGTRPLAPVNQDEDKVYEQVLRFAQLQKKFGWWGLAYIEGILRAADAYVSEGFE
jgi:CRISPR-associated endonuclease/helicase Cas3